MIKNLINRSTFAHGQMENQLPWAGHIYGNQCAVYDKENNEFFFQSVEQESQHMNFSFYLQQKA